MARYTKTDQFTLGGQNTENEKIETAINDTLSRKGDSPNAMEADLDMNSHRILNLPSPSNRSEPATKAYVDRLSNISVSDESLWKRPTDFGAEGDGVTDDTAALQAAFDSGAPILIDTTYRYTDNLTTSYYFTCTSGKLLYDGPEKSLAYKPLIVQSPHFGDIILDCNNKTVRAVLLDGSSKQYGGTIYVEKINSDANTDPTSIGVYSETSEVYLKGIVTKDFTNTGNSNDSMPQSVAPLANSKIFVDTITADNCRAVVVIPADSELEANNVYITNPEDNGVYNLGGKCYINKMTFVAGSTVQEPVVNQGYTTIDHLVIQGKTLCCFNVQNAEYTEINKISAIPADGVDESTPDDYRENVPQCLYYHRSGNTATDKIKLGYVEGDLGRFLIRTGFSTGTTDYLSIEGYNIKLWYDLVDTSFDEDNWFNMLGVNQFDIKGGLIRMIDTNSTLSGSTLFDAQWVPSKFSTIENLDVSFHNVDGTLSTTGSSGAQFRGSSQNQYLMIKGAYWQTNTSTVYIREQQFGSSRRDYFQNDVLPQSGYWWTGQTFLVNASTNVQFIRCDVSGDAGTSSASFVRSGGIASTDVTANRTLSFDDADTELVYTGASTLTTTIDTNANQPIDNKSKISFLVAGTAQQTVTAVAGVTINGVDGGSFTLSQYQTAIITKVGTDAWVVNGENSNVA